MSPQLGTTIWKDVYGNDTIMGARTKCRDQLCAHDDAAVRTLIASDDRRASRLMAYQLSKWGCDPTVCETGDEAWNILQSDGAPTFAILDRMKPAMKGSDICRRLRARGKQPYVYVILLTSTKGKEGIVAGLNSGADDYLVKPVDPFKLKARVRVAVAQDQLRRALTLAEFRASHDALTRLLNRASIMEILTKELIRSGRLGSSLGLINR